MVRSCEKHIWVLMAGETKIEGIILNSVNNEMLMVFQQTYISREERKGCGVKRRATGGQKRRYSHAVHHPIVFVVFLFFCLVVLILA